MMIYKPFGSWGSPITSKAITSGSVELGGLYFCGNELYWLEGRPQEAGRIVLCRYAPNESSKSKRNGVDVTPKDSNVRSQVHEYGGGAVVFRKEKDQIYYSEFSTQCLCKLSEDGSSSPISSEGGLFRFADGVLSEDGLLIYCVRENHEKPEPANVVNEVVSINVKDGSMTVTASGNDFYSSPRLSPDGTKLVYVTWNHPNMPWDATQLRVTSVTASSSDSNQHEFIAGKNGKTSIIQPLWHPLTGDLFYISDESGFYNIYRAGYNQSVLPMLYDFGGLAPGC